MQGKLFYAIIIFLITNEILIAAVPAKYIHNCYDKFNLIIAVDI